MKRSLAAWLDQKTTGDDDSMPAYDDLLDTVETSMLETLLQRFDHKPTRLAAALKMNRATLRRKLKED
jgi:two-component system nitrogen regulation response regulator GlnG/two-component system response regulator AtoC